MQLRAIILILSASFAFAQYLPGGPTQPGLPDGCLGSFPDIKGCAAAGWSIPDNDPCKPSQIPLPGQQVSIIDATNFCLNLPDPQSIFLQNLFYNQSQLPTFVQAEGYVRARCMGDYVAPNALPMPSGAIRNAHVKKYANYIQIHGLMDCAAMNINCTQSAPGAYDDGGQYDDGAYVHCGKEPYSGVDNSKHPGWTHYVEMGGDGMFCMRICTTESQTVGGVCDVTHDTEGCTAFMGVQFTEADGVFITEDMTTGQVFSTVVALPSSRTTTSTTSSMSTATAVATSAGASSDAGASGGASAAGGTVAPGQKIASADAGSAGAGSRSGAVQTSVGIWAAVVALVIL